MLQRLLAGGLDWLALAAFAAAPATDNAPNARAKDAGAIPVGLNRAEPAGNGCRLSFLIRNRTSHALTSLQWDLVFFDSDGLIAGRVAAETAPLPTGRTSVKVFDVPSLPCARLKRILINDVLRCAGESGDSTALDCLGLTVASSRAAIAPMK